MVSSFIICGSGHLPREEEEEENRHRHERTIQSAVSTPPRASSSSRYRNHNQHHKKNPYATRGLDKFSALLAEIEDKRQRIYSEISPDEICFVQFDYSKGNNCKPIVIKVKPNKDENDKASHQIRNKKHKHSAATTTDNDHRKAPEHPLVTNSKERSQGDGGPTMQMQANEKILLRSFKLHKLRKPCYYLPAVMILILFFLALFGRSVAILCTSVGWYMIPTISSWNSSLRRFSKKKALVGHQGG